MNNGFNPQDQQPQGQQFQQGQPYQQPQGQQFQQGQPYQQPQGQQFQQPQGQQFYPPYQPYGKPPKKSNIFALLSLLTGLATFVMFLFVYIGYCACGGYGIEKYTSTPHATGAIWGFLGVICGILAIVFFVLSRKAGKDTMAIAGLICGIIGLVLCLIPAIGCTCNCVFYSSAENTVNDAVNDIFNSIW